MTWDNRFEEALERDWYSWRRYLNKYFWKSNIWPPRRWKMLFPKGK